MTTAVQHTVGNITLVYALERYDTKSSPEKLLW